jgi:hypoxanthine phosphoribosyltransferase
LTVGVSLNTNYPDKLKVLYSRQEIEAAVTRLAAEITRDYRGRNPLVIGVLKGCFIFMSDLVRRLEFPLETDFVQLSSYGRGTNSSGKIKIAQDLKTPVNGRDVLVVEDIVDTGRSLAFLTDYLRRQKGGPASVKFCCLLDKPSRRQVPVTVEYRGFTVPDKFVVGYGMDYAEGYRNLPDICIMSE